MTYVEAVETAWERSRANGSLSSRELCRLLAEDVEAYADYRRMRDRESPPAPAALAEDTIVRAPR